jgi:outer membrane receptor protein involved in Fe transport
LSASMSTVSSTAIGEQNAQTPTETVELNVVNVVATRREPNLFEKPTSALPALSASMSTVSSIEIGAQNAQTVTDAIEYTPGVLTETRGRKVKQFTSFRGQRYPYPDYAINGTLLREFHETSYFFPVYQVERIEVMRSSAALLMGLSGQAGVINIVPKRFEDPGAVLDLQYGTFDTVRASGFVGGPLSKGGYTLGAGFYKTEGPQDKHAAESVGNFNGTIDWEFSDNLTVEANLMLIHGSRELALASDPAAKRLQETDEEYDPFTSQILNIRSLYRPNERASTELMLYYANRSHDFKSTTPGVHLSLEERDYTYGASVMQALGITANNLLRFGALYDRWVAPDGKRFFAGKRCDLHTLSGVVVDEHQFGKLVVDGGFRYTQTYMADYGAYNINGSSKGLKQVDPLVDTWDEPVLRGSVGARYSVRRNLVVLSNLESGLVKPRAGSLDTDLKEPGTESRTMVDLGVELRHSENSAELKVVGFFALRDDALTLDGATSESSDGRVLELYKNQDIRQYGIEIDARTVRIFDYLELFANATVMESEARDGGSYESYRDLPDTIVSAGVYGHFGRIDCNLFGKYVSSYESKRFAGDGQYHPLGDYTELNAKIEYRIGDDDRSRVYLAVANLTDEKYSTVVGYPDYGRRVNVGVRKAF